MFERVANVEIGLESEVDEGELESTQIKSVHAKKVWHDKESMQRDVSLFSAPMDTRHNPTNLCELCQSR